MSVRLRDVHMRQLDELRYEPIDKRIRGLLDGVTVIDSTRAMLVWEPKRVVPTYAFPIADVDAELVAAPPAEDVDPTAAVPRLGGRIVYDPSVPFAVRTTAGEPVTIRARDGGREAAGFRADDEALAGHVIVDFAAFDEWYEEDERNLGHPRDPFHRIVVDGVPLPRVETPWSKRR
jgi:hypothetical protein